MKVYVVVIWHEYEGADAPENVFSSLEKAEKFALDFEEKNTEDTLSPSIYSYEIDVENSGETVRL